jgi:cell wall-associated NlpC family hydrolase
MDDLNAEIINTLTSIGMKEDEIAEKETELVNKQADIDDTAAQYEEAKEDEATQYADMIVRLRKMYETGEESSMDLLLGGNGLSEMLNRMDFVESVYEYDRSRLEQYQEVKEQVLELWNQLEAEKLELETDKENLETDKTNLESQKVELDGLLAQKKKQSSNYDAEIKKARQEASVAKTKLQQEQQRLKNLQGGTTSAASGTYTTDYNSVIDKASGSSLGKQIAKYACQYIGNPYVAGGTSLTNGADCSGFTYRVYSDFGYTLPRTSTEQRSAGTGVSYSEAQPGDLICYSGHVALYIGGGLIVHASTQKTGIKVSNAEYRTILAVRRII